MDCQKIVHYILMLCTGCFILNGIVASTISSFMSSFIWTLYPCNGFEVEYQCKSWLLSISGYNKSLPLVTDPIHANLPNTRSSLRSAGSLPEGIVPLSKFCFVSIHVVLLAFSLPKINFDPNVLQKVSL